MVYYRSGMALGHLCSFTLHLQLRSAEAMLRKEYHEWQSKFGKAGGTAASAATSVTEVGMTHAKPATNLELRTPRSTCQATLRSSPTRSNSPLHMAGPTGSAASVEGPYANPQPSARTVAGSAFTPSTSRSYNATSVSNSLMKTPTTGECSDRNFRTLSRVSIRQRPGNAGGSLAAPAFPSRKMPNRP